MSKKPGCSTPILIAGLVFFAMFIFAFLFGPLGSKLFGLNVPEWMAVSKPEIQLKSEAVAHISWFTITNTLIASWLTIIVLGTFFYFATRKMKLIPGRLQNFAEVIIEILLNFASSVGEKHARMLLPLLATIFLYVVTNAYLALFPFFDGTIYIVEPNGFHAPIIRAANTDINLPLSLAIVSFLYAEIQGLRTHGLFRYLNSFFQAGKLREGFAYLFKGKIKPALGSLTFGFINLFIGVLEVIGHLVRLVSFTFRLFGNMTAGVILLSAVTFLVPFIAAIPFYGLEMLVGLVQAMIFGGLTMVFSAMAMTSHDIAH